MKRRRPKVDREFGVSVREAVRQRADWRCERCRIQPIGEFHHKLRRSQGGLGTLENCAGLCSGFDGSCHAWVHDNVDAAVAEGWLIRGAGRVAS